MKTKIKRHSRSVLSVILAISMLVSCMMVGVIATDAARVSTEDSVGDSSNGMGTIFFDNTLTGWEHVYLFIGKANNNNNGDWSACYEMTATTNNSNVFYYAGSNNWKDATHLFFADSQTTTALNPNNNGTPITNVSGMLPSSAHYTGYNDAIGPTMNSIFAVKETSNGAQLYKKSTYVVVGNNSPFRSTGNSGWTINSTSESTFMNYDGSKCYITFNNVPAGNYTFALNKFNYTNDWSNAKRWAEAGGSSGTLTANGLGSWAGASDGDNNIKLTLTDTANVTIEYGSVVDITLNSPETRYAVTLATDGHGTVTPNSKQVGATAQSLPAPVPADGYVFSRWTTNSSDITITNPTDPDNATVSARGAGTVTANFVPNTNMKLYIAGRFRVRNSAGSDQYTYTFGDNGSGNNGDWGPKAKYIPFDYTGSGTLYKVDTFSSIGELSQKLGVGYSGDPVFFVYDDTNSADTLYYATESTSMTKTNGKGTASDKITLASSGGADGNLKFDDSTATDTPVTIFYDTNTHELWYKTVDPNSEGLYSLSGNVTDKYIVGSTLVKPTGIDENYWWSHYWDETAINNKVSDGVFSITFTTTSYEDESGYCANIGFASKNNVQYAFIMNGTPYNTWGNDLPVTRDITDSDNLYVYTKNTGGSLKLRPNTTYTITVDQTQQQASGQPYGKITIDATTVYANAINMVRPFDVTNRRPSDLEQSNAGGTLTVTSVSSTDSTSGDKTTATVTHAKPMTATYTASSANSGYTFAGWYSDEDCTTKVSDDLSYTPDEFSVTKTLYALYTEDEPSTSYNVTVTKSGTGDGTISVTGAAVSSESGNTVTYSAYAGATVTVTAAPSTSPLSVLASITGSGATVSGNTATIENIAANKALTVTFTEKTTYTVTLKGTNGTVSAISYQADGTTQYATASATNNGTIEVPIGGTVKLTAAADTGYEFSNWALTAGKYKRKADQSLDSSPVTIRPTDDMTAEAKFGTAGASSSWDVNFTSHSAPTTSNPNLKKYTGLKVKDFNDDSTKDVYYAKFTLKSGANEFHMWDGTRDYKFTSDPQVVTFDNNYYPQATNNGYGNATHPGQITVDADTEVYVYAMYQTQDKELKIRFTKTKAHGDSSTISTDGYQRIYAMDGTLGSTAGYGDTVITIGNGLLEKDIEDASGNSELYVDAHTNHNVYYFDPNQNISFRVQTTVDSAQTKLGVRGFVYNGKSVDAIDDGDGVYYADITVKANSVLDINGGTTNNPILEVIPVYYNTTVPSSEFITFYVDANTMDNKFGYNIGYYIWYQGSGNEVQGNYPGQPLLRSGTKYVGYIPKHYVSNTDTYSNSSTEFSGVLLNNLHENSSVHDECLESWGCDKTNYQTFDYEDPYVISQIQDVDTIEFVAKFEETNSNHQTGTHWYNSTYNKAELKGVTSGYAFPSDISAPNSASQLNGFELLRNFDNKPVDVYGNELSTVNFADSVFIISVGNQDNGSANDWDTVWMIYQGGTGEHTLIKGDIPSSFINVADGSQLSTLKNKPAYISYEKFLDGSENAQTHSSGGATGNTGDRIDGRWLYTKSTDETNGRIRVATLGKNNDTLSFLTYDEGASGARIAYYDNSVDGITQNENSTKEDNYGRKTTFANRTTTAKAVLNEPIGYKIKGFYMLKTGVSGSDNGFSYSISDYDEMVRESATVAKYTNARDTWIVAVVEAVPASNLYLKHEMYGGPGAHSGAGDFYIKADVVNANGTVVATSGDFVDGNDGYEFEYLNSVVQKGQGYKVKVTLRTVMAGTNTFYSWFTSDLATGDYDEKITTNSAGNNARGQNTPQETVIEVSVDDLFGSKTDGSFEYTNLAYYSDIDMGGAVNITHSLKDGSVGSGTTYASVRVLNGGNEVATFNTDYSATGTITVPSQYTKRTSGNTIEITLRTVPDEYSTFNKFWESDGTTEITGASVDSTTRIATKTLPTIAVSSLYNNTGTEQNPKYEFDTTKSSYQYYSDLTKSEYRYVIEYQYKSRIWGTQSYKVPAASNDEAFTVEEFNKYINEAQVTDATTGSTVSGISFKTDALKKEFLASKAPYEDNFRETITWNFTGATVSYYDSGKQLSIKVTTSSTDDDALHLLVHFPFECTVQTTGLDVTRDSENKVQYVEGKTNYTARPLYMHRYTVNNKYDLTSEIYLQAPESVWRNGEEKFFSYWSLKDQKTGREYAKCYSRNLNYAFYQDTVVDLAYDNTSALSPSDNADKGTSARIEFLENTRNQWNSNPGTSSWNPADRVISDFVLYYNYLGKQINTIQNMKAGLVFETVGNLDTDEHDAYITNRFTYASKHASDNLTTLKENVISFIGENKSSNETYLKSEFNTYRDTTRPAETINKNNGLDNKNEIEYYYTMAANGTKERELKYYRVYSYLKDANGNVVAVSDPIYLTIYDIASIQNGSASMPGV